MKTSFTKTYNKSSHLQPYAADAVSKKGKAGKGGSLQGMEEMDSKMGGELEEESEEDADMHAMIKVIIYILILFVNIGNFICNFPVFN